MYNICFTLGDPSGDGHANTSELMGLHIMESDMSIYNTVQNIMEKYNKKAIFDDLDKYDYLAKESDFIEVTEWHNGEGWDIYINDTHISLTSGQLDAINYLTKSLDLSK